MLLPLQVSSDFPLTLARFLLSGQRLFRIPGLFLPLHGLSAFMQSRVILSQPRLFPEFLFPFALKGQLMPFQLHRSIGLPPLRCSPCHCFFPFHGDLDVKEVARKPVPSFYPSGLAALDLKLLFLRGDLSRSCLVPVSALVPSKKRRPSKMAGTYRPPAPGMKLFRCTSGERITCLQLSMCPPFREFGFFARLLGQWHSRAAV